MIAIAVSLGLEVSVIGLGCCMGVSHTYRVADEQESIVTIHGALELGRTFLDTAEAANPRFINAGIRGGL
jgi:aryl-alcohol dehydrogenase-like predicted oxidoreductase